MYDKINFGLSAIKMVVMRSEMRLFRLARKIILKGLPTKMTIMTMQHGSSNVCGQDGSLYTISLIDPRHNLIIHSIRCGRRVCIRVVIKDTGCISTYRKSWTCISSILREGCDSCNPK